MYNKKLSNIKLKEGLTAQHPGIDIVQEYSIIYGDEVNNERAICYIFDGLKPSHRKQIVGGINQSPEKFIKGISMAGNIVGIYYAHGEASLQGVIDELVHQGIFDGQGAFSRKFIDDSEEPMASMRYVECRLNSTWREIFSKLLPYVPKFRNEFGNMEPVYLPTPIPLCLMFSSQGIGFGVRSTVPGFKAKSLINAYLHNDPNLLESFYDYNINTDLKTIWNDPKCAINFSYNIYREKFEFSTKDSVVITGDTKLFTPKYTKELQSWVKEGRVFLSDLSDEKNMLVFSIMSNMKFPSVEDLEKQVKKSCEKTLQYEIKASYNGKVKPISIKNWVEVTFNNYCKLLDLYKKDNLEKLEFQQSVIDNFESVVDLVFKKLSNQEIQKKLKIDIEIINAITKKSINTINNFDKKKESDRIKEDKKKYKFDNTKYVLDLINNIPEIGVC